MKPCRIQRKRTKGYNMQAESMALNGLPAAYVGRPTQYGNFYSVAKIDEALIKRFGWFPAKDIKDVLRLLSRELYRLEIKTLTDNYTIIPLWLENLRGKNLACWCSLCDEHKDGLPLGIKCNNCAPCHADVPLELANREMP